MTKTKSGAKPPKASSSSSNNNKGTVQSKLSKKSPLVASVTALSPSNKTENESIPEPVPPHATTTYDGNDERKVALSSNDSVKKQKRSSSQKKSKSKKQKQEDIEYEKEKLLTGMLFGSSNTTTTSFHSSSYATSSDNNNKKNKKNKDIDSDDNHDDDENNLFQIDRKGEERIMDDTDDHYLEDEDDDEMNNNKYNTNNRGLANMKSSTSNDNAIVTVDDNNAATSSTAPVWVDEDDTNVQIQLYNDNHKNTRLRKLCTSKSELLDTNTNAWDGSILQQRLRQRYITTAQTSANTEWATIPTTATTQQSSSTSNDDKYDDGTNIIISSSESLLASSSKNNPKKRLPPNIIDIVRCQDANATEPNQSAVRSVHFYKGMDTANNMNQPQLLLTAGYDKTLRFFQLRNNYDNSSDNNDNDKNGSTSIGDDVTSEKVHGIHFPKLPINSAYFLGTSSKVIVTGRRPYFYIYDPSVGKLDHVPNIIGYNTKHQMKSLEYCVPSPCGTNVAFSCNDGYILVVDVATRTKMYDLKINGTVRAISYHGGTDYGNSNYDTQRQEILASGSDGDVYRFDVRHTRNCIERFSNQDGTITSAIASSSANHIAVGAESGVVNLYSDHQQQSSLSSFQSSNNNYNNFYTSTNMNHREPIKSIMNLKTSVDNIKFNYDGQIMAMSSSRDPTNALRLVHVPTATIFSNWPTTKTPLNYIWSIDFSPSSNFIAIGTDKGFCRLYRLKHYS